MKEEKELGADAAAVVTAGQEARDAAPHVAHTPELLEALQFIREALEARLSIGVVPSFTTLHELSARAESAIANAEGRARS